MTMKNFRKNDHKSRDVPRKNINFNNFGQSSFSCQNFRRKFDRKSEIFKVVSKSLKFGRDKCFSMLIPNMDTKNSSEVRHVTYGHFFENFSSS